MGPEALEISREEFKARLKPFRGEIKGILTRGDFVAGIGNAYADEILWTAKLLPYRKKTSLTPAEVDRLYDGMRACLLETMNCYNILLGLGGSALENRRANIPAPPDRGGDGVVFLASDQSSFMTVSRSRWMGQYGPMSKRYCLPAPRSRPGKLEVYSHWPDDSAHQL